MADLDERLAKLRDSQVDGEADARHRALATVRAAYGEHQPRRGRRRWLAGASAALAAIAAAVIGLTPAGAEIRQWVEDTVDPQATDPKPALTRLPGGGTLLAESAAGISVVQSDGSRRFLGDFSATSWSPNGLYVAGAAGGVLSANEPTGAHRWSISAPGPVRFPVWSQNLGFRVAYISGGELRVVAGDGSGDRRLAAASAAQPAWRGRTDRVLAFVDPGGDVRVIDVDRAVRLGQFSAPAGVTQLAFSTNGRRLLALSPGEVRLSDADGGDASLYRPTPGAEIRSAGFLRGGRSVAIVESRRAPSGGLSSVVSLLQPRGEKATPRVVFRTPGRLSGFAVSPGGEWLVVGWKDADQWLFLQPHPGGKLRAVDNVAEQLAPGSRKPPFPAPAEWCCQPR